MQSKINTQAALLHFKNHDNKMARFLEHALVGENPMQVPKQKPESAWFGTIVRSITSQQISTRAAAAVFERIKTVVPDLTPDHVQHTPRAKLCACGLSERKTDYILHNAQMWHTLPIKEFYTMSDEEIITEMTKLYGIGRWTVEMFLMFSLARPNVFSYGDLGLMQGLYESYQYRPHWNRKIAATVDAWAPHKTIASLTLWYYKDNGPLIL
jgi:DNA-3-methyladenine glycosylase II